MRKHFFQAILLLCCLLFAAVAISPQAAAKDVTREQARHYLEVKAAVEAADSRLNWSWDEFVLVNGDHETYPAKTVAGYVPASRPPPRPGPPSPVVRHDGERLPEPTADGLHFDKVPVHVRANFDDVLSIEDPTVSNFGGTDKKHVSDLTGAQFSYTRDFRAGSDIWSAKGAVIVPIHNDPRRWDDEHRDTKTTDIGIRSYGLTPSVSFDRETDSRDSSKDVNSLVFRLGAYATAIGLPGHSTATLRLFGTYGTDFDFRSETPAGEFELEPSIPGNDLVGLGSVHYPLSRLRKEPLDSKSIKQFAFTNLGYQLRFILHGVYGRTVDAGKKTDVPEQDFARLGPKLQLRLDPLFTQALTCTVNYEYLADFTGHSPNEGLLTVEPAYTLNPPAADATTLDKPLFKIKSTYQNGGVDLTKEKVHSFLIGLGVTY